MKSKALGISMMVLLGCSVGDSEAPAAGTTLEAGQTAAVPVVQQVEIATREAAPPGIGLAAGQDVANNAAAGVRIAQPGELPPGAPPLGSRPGALHGMGPIGFAPPGYEGIAGSPNEFLIGSGSKIPGAAQLLAMLPGAPRTLPGIPSTFVGNAGSDATSVATSEVRDACQAACVRAASCMMNSAAPTAQSSADNCATSCARDPGPAVDRSVVEHLKNCATRPNCESFNSCLATPG